MQMCVVCSNRNTSCERYIKSNLQIHFELDLQNDVKTMNHFKWNWISNKRKRELLTDADILLPARETRFVFVAYFVEIVLGLEATILVH